MSFEVTAWRPVQGIKETPNNPLISAFTLTDTCRAAKIMSVTAFSVVCDVWDGAKECVDRRGPILDETRWQEFGEFSSMIFKVNSKLT